MTEVLVLIPEATSTFKVSFILFLRSFLLGSPVNECRSTIQK